MKEAQEVARRQALLTNLLQELTQSLHDKALLSVSRAGLEGSVALNIRCGHGRDPHDTIFSRFAIRLIFSAAPRRRALSSLESFRFRGDVAFSSPGCPFYSGKGGAGAAVTTPEIGTASRPPRLE